MPYPDKVLGEDEEVVRHLHPHWLTVLRPVVLFLVLVGATSFGAALVPAGPDRATWRVVLVVAALVLGLVFVAVPLLRWRTTHYVLTTHRLLYRTGVLARQGRDIGLSRVTDVSFRQSVWDRVVNSGTVSIETAGEGGPTVFSAIPDSEGVQQLLNQLVEEDADRRGGSRSAGPSGWDDDRDDDWDDGEATGRRRGWSTRPVP